jgi:AmpE protein
MFVTLIAVIVALALGHLAHALALSVRQYGWFGQWMHWLDARFPDDGFWRGRYGIVLALLPPLLVLLLFQLALDGPVYGLPALLFGIVVLFYAWGPSDLDLDVDAIVEARDPVERHAAASRLWSPGEQVSLDGPSLVGAVFRNAQRRWFGVLFWFLLLGPVGALLYRLVTIAAEGNAAHLLPADTVAGARGLLAVLDWPVGQLMTLSMALVGNFDAVFSAWKEGGGASFALDGGFLAAAARACVRSELADDAEDATESGVPASKLSPATVADLPELRDAMSLVWRILLVWLAVLALFVVAGWVS